jgi:hypothetical protein
MLPLNNLSSDIEKRGVRKNSLCCLLRASVKLGHFFANFLADGFFPHPNLSHHIVCPLLCHLADNHI